MKYQNTIQEVRNSSTKICKQSKCRTSVIVEIPYLKTKSVYAVQFWTKEMIDCGIAKNTDNTVSKFIEVL